MKKDFLTRLAVAVLVIIAFIDGMMVAEKIQEKPVDAREIINFEEIFKFLPKEEETEPQTTPQIIEETTIQPEFTSQTPLGIWREPWDEYSEEACAYMAVKWALGEEMPDQTQVANDLLAIGTWEGKVFGTSKQTSAAQTMEILTDYFGYHKVELQKATPDSLINLLNEGKIAILTVDGRILQNPHYSNPAPAHHTILLTGYDQETKEFITNDPGTRYGISVRYSQQKILDSILDDAIIISS
ncbi:C39 family peptidase [Patescibacteria group bacterium]|nr:C39 family peptidase [Patescibacteria group bacterium]